MRVCLALEHCQLSADLVRPPRLSTARVSLCTPRISAVVTGLHRFNGYGWRALMRAAGDRRSQVRFEVFGAFWGSYDAGDAVRVHDLTQQGALIETAQALAVESIQSVCLMLDGHPAVADARVRHLRPLPGQPNRFLVGVEFLTVSTAFSEAVERLLAYRSRPTEPT